MGIDKEKARLLVKHLVRANKKISMRNHAVRVLHDEIQELKKLSGKSSEAKIEQFEKRILTTLKEGGFIHETKQEVSYETERPMPELSVPEIPQEEISMVAEMSQQRAKLTSRDERLKSIEDAARGRAQQKRPEINVEELARLLKRLEHARKKIRVKGRAEQEQASVFVAKIKGLKRKIAAIKKESVLVKKPKKMKKTVSRKRKRISTK